MRQGQKINTGQPNQRKLILADKLGRVTQIMLALDIINLAGCVLLFGPVIYPSYLWELGYHKP